MIGILLYTLLFAASAGTGLPLGFALFGRRHPAAWIVGALLGYGLTQMAFWAVIVSGLASVPGFVAAWIILAGATVLTGRVLGSTPAIPLKPWTANDVRALAVAVSLAPVLMGITYRNLGREDQAGNRYYRAYFTADFVWHAALTYELGRFSLPPTNPYLAPRTMNYYWTYFLLPAAVAELAPPATGLHDVERCLKTNAMLVGILMMASLFLLVRSAVATPAPAALAVVLVTVAASAEGLYAIVDLVRRNRPLAGLTDINVDAVTGWAPFLGLRIDNIPRSLWYTPQHTTSLALGLAGLSIASLGGSAGPLRAVAGAGLALGLSTTMNPLLGAVCSALYGVCVFADAWGRRDMIRRLAIHSLAAVPVVLAVGWGAASKVTAGAGAALAFGMHTLARSHPLETLALSLGPVLFPALVGIWRPGTARRPVIIAAAGVLIGLLLLYFVRISEASWVGFRAGQILLVSIPVLLARTIERLHGATRLALCLAILAVGLPTTIADTYNAQDIRNLRPGPGFRWTLWTSPGQQEAFAWLRQHTPADAVVQMEPIVRDREHWTLIPSFAGRRMAAGLPISLLPQPEYQERSLQVRQIFASPDAAEASRLSHALGIDYLYVDQDDIRAYPDGVAKFGRAGPLFDPVFDNGVVRIYRVR